MGEEVIKEETMRAAGGERPKSGSPQVGNDQPILRQAGASNAKKVVEILGQGADKVNTQVSPEDQAF